MRDGNAIAETGRSQFFTGNERFEYCFPIKPRYFAADQSGNMFEYAFLAAARHVHFGTAGGQDFFKSDHV